MVIHKRTEAFTFPGGDGEEHGVVATIKRPFDDVVVVFEVEETAYSTQGARQLAKFVNEIADRMENTDVA